MKKILNILLISIFFYACVKENNEIEADSYDRTSVLTNWVNNLAIPALTDYHNKIESLDQASQTFIANPTEITLTAVQTALTNAQKVWQHVAMFELQGTTRIYVNTYPIDRETSTEPLPNSNEDDRTIQSNLDSSINEINQIDFTSSATIDEQGLPALDFIINQENAVANFTNTSTEANYKAYLKKVVDRLVLLASNGKDYWVNNASSIIANNGSNANASFDKMVNDYINYVEQGFRENKVATPSGKRDGEASKNPYAVEGYYHSEYSKIYYNEAFKAIQNFYNGTSYDGTKTGAGLKDYLDFVKAEVYVVDDNKDYAVTTYIDSKFDNIAAIADGLNDDFVIQVKEATTDMFPLFNEIQSFVVLFKANVFQSLGVVQDYVDSDGD